MPKTKVGFALTGSFCTFDKAISTMQNLTENNYDITPIMSANAAFTNTRFGACEDIKAKISKICDKEIITDIVAAEPIGPQKLLDILIIAPCTGNTIGKLAGGITDTSVTMAAKSHLRNNRPLLIAISTNDGLAASAKNIGLLLNQRNVYFVPLAQDDPSGKPRSLVADFTKIEQGIELALKGEQIQPIF